MLKIGTILGNRYEILEKIGAGGMSIVYRARDTKLERSVTVKVLRDEFIADEDFVSRFKIEAQAAASLSHPNIVNVYDVGTEYDTYYIVMEYINGFTLKEIIDKEAPFDNKKALNYALKIASALQHAHKNHIVHRDIKPQNILVTADGELKVTDFGIAHAATSSTVTMTSTAIGSVHYFSPEQARGGYVDEKSDLYSLGIVIYEMVTGKLPFEGDSSVSIALKHINEELPSIHQFNPEISKSLEGIILKATQKRVDQRYSDIDSMIVDMKKALNDPSGEFIKQTDLAFSTTQKLSGEDLKAIRESKKEVYEDDDYEVDDYEDTKRTYEIDDDYEVDDDGLNKSEEIKLIISAVATAFAIVVVIFTVAFVTLKNSTSPNNLISAEVYKDAPDLTGKTLDEAAVMLGDYQLRLSPNYKKAESDEYEKGIIINQEPPVGSKVKKDSEIVVTISEGTQKYEVPDLIGKSELEAAEEIEAGKKFNSTPIREYSESGDIGTVIRQNPQAGEMAKLGTEITVYISRGPAPKQVTVPSIVGLSESGANSKLKAAGLVGSPSYSESDSVSKGRVISQAEPSGKEVSQGSTISFVVSSGKKEIESTIQPTTEAKNETTESTRQNISTTEVTTESTTETTESKTKELTTKSMTITIPQPSDTNVDKVHVEILRITNDGTFTVYDNQKNISGFPYSVDVNGNSGDEFQLYFDEKLQAYYSMD